MKSYLITTFFILLITTCTKDLSIDNNQETVYFVGSTFTLAAKECVTLKDTTINKSYNFCFTNVKEYRCFNSECFTCFGTEAIIQVQLDSIYVNLKIIGCIEEASGPAIIPTDTLGLSFKLLKLDPYPDTTNMPVPFNIYNAKMQITKLS